MLFSIINIANLLVVFGTTLAARTMMIHQVLMTKGKPRRQGQLQHEGIPRSLLTVNKHHREVTQSFISFSINFPY
jgi:hypothetical protein